MCWHDWGRWSDPIPYTGSFGAKVIKQLRICVKCGKADARTVDYVDPPDDSGDEIGQ